MSFLVHLCATSTLIKKLFFYLFHLWLINWKLCGSLIENWPFQTILMCPFPMGRHLKLIRKSFRNILSNFWRKFKIPSRCSNEKKFSKFLINSINFTVENWRQIFFLLFAQDTVLEFIVLVWDYNGWFCCIPN